MFRGTPPGTRLPVRAGGLARRIPTISAAVITALGVGLTIRGLDTFPDGATGVAGALRDHLQTGTVAAVAAAVFGLAAVATAARRRQPIPAPRTRTGAS